MVKARIANPWSKPPSISFGKYFIDGNYVDDSYEVTNDNWKGVVLEKGTVTDVGVVKKDKPLPVEEVTTQTAKDAYTSVLAHAGASYKRDTMDERIINEVKKRTGRFIDVQGGFPHGTPYEQTIKAWPALQSLPAPADTDKDGMPDEWEKKNGLNPADAADATGYKLDKLYTNIEIYINGLIK
jgi:hypothetical protein